MLIKKLKIEKLLHGGLGLSRTGDGVVLVAGVVGGETVEAEILGSKGGVPVAACISVLNASPFRRSSPCVYGGVCGGCDWLHIAYEEQLRAKQGIFSECLRRQGRLQNVPDIEVFAAGEWGYRCRAQLKVDLGAQSLGFFRRKSNKVVRIDRCPLLTDPMNEVLQNQDSIMPLLDSNRQLRLVSGSDGTLASSPILPKRTSPSTIIEVGYRHFTVRGDGFFQGNRYLHKELGTWAEDAVGGDLLLDLYGGVGFFSVLLGGKFKKTLLIESDSRLVEQAKQNFKANHMSGMDARVFSTEKFVSSASLGKNPDCLVLDPPRPGLTRQAREGVRDLGAKTILYISCNPSTQGRDIGFFVNQCGYIPKRLALFDLYPQTHHLETAVLLTK